MARKLKINSRLTLAVVTSHHRGGGGGDGVRTVLRLVGEAALVSKFVHHELEEGKKGEGDAAAQPYWVSKGGRRRGEKGEVGDVVMRNGRVERR